MRRIYRRIGSILMLFPAAALLFVQSGCLRQVPLGRRAPLAVVNGEPVDLDYIRKSFKSKHGDIIVLLKEEGGLERYLNRAIDLKLLSQEAYRIGLDESEEIIAEVGSFKRKRAVAEMLKDLQAAEKDSGRRREIREKFLRELRESADIEIDEEALPRLLAGDEGRISEGTVLARVNGEPIKAGEFLSRLNRRRVRELPEPKALEKTRAELKALIDDLLLTREAQRRGYMEKEELLREAGFFEENLVRNLLYNEVILPYIKPSDREVEEYYRKHSTEFTIPERIKVSHILLKTREEAKQVLLDLKNGAPFERLALNRSADSGSSQRLGSIGWVTRGMLDPEFERAAFSLKVGEISNIVKTRFGFHIIRVEARKEAELLDFPRAKRLAYKKVLEKKREERISFFLSKLRERSRIEIDSKRVEELQKGLMEGEDPKDRSDGHH